MLVSKKYVGIPETPIDNGIYICSNMKMKKISSTMANM